MKQDWWNNEFKILFTLGESTTAGGWSSCRERCWAAQLARLINEFQRVPVQLVNMGIGANLISDKCPAYAFSGKPAANERLEEHVLSHHANGNLLRPDLLVISYGLNDARGGTPIDLFCTEMKDIICRVREEIQPLIVILGPYYMNDFTLGGTEWSHGSLEVFYEYEKAMEQLAGDCDCLFVKLLESYRQADWAVHHDGCHANDLGHRIIANKIFEVLATNCSGLSLETKELEKSIPLWRDESTLQE
jgi:lysophospholipase L1-like esterase